MGFSKTSYKNFHKECINRFGNVIGNRIYVDAEQRLEAIISEIEDRNSENIRWHLEKFLLPTIAMYLSLKNSKDIVCDACQVTLDICQEVAIRQKKRMWLLGNMPFGYYIFKLFGRGVILKMYSEIGWRTEWIRYDFEEVHFNYYSCLYRETTEKYQCPEMCSIFCENDVTIFSGFSPNIIFERSSTIANGNEFCDFHFKNGKYGGM